MKVLITGALGFLGQSTVKALLSRKHQISMVVRPSRIIEAQKLFPSVTVFGLDLRSPSYPDNLFDDIEVVINLAVQANNEDYGFADTISGTEKFLTAMEKSNVNQLIHMSSFSVYDWSKNNGYLDEESKLLTDSFVSGTYAAAKLWQEKLVRQTAKNNSWKLKILRPGFLWGKSNAYPPCLGFRLGDIHIVIDGSRPLALMHVDNCARAICIALESDFTDISILNLIDNHKVTALRYVRDYLDFTKDGESIFLFPGWIFRNLAKLMHYLGLILGKGKYSLPIHFEPNQVGLRFSAINMNTSKLIESAIWQLSFSYDECLERTYGHFSHQ